MHIAFLVPDIHDRPTGGNVYNRRIIEALRRWGTVEAVPWAEDSPPPTLELPSGATIVIDSLLAARLDGLDALRATHPSATMVLLAHYLRCMDPETQDMAAADVERAALRRVDGVVTTSRFAKRTLRDEGVPDYRIAVARPGLDAAYRAPLPDRDDDEPPRLLTVASLLPGKGLPCLLDVLARLSGLAWRWVLAGDDTLAPEFATSVRAQAADSPVADRLTIAGPVPPDVLRVHYDRADVFVLPSHFETCSMSTREAMARGCPVVGFDVGGLPENFGGAAAGRLVPPGDPAALTDALRHLCTNPAARRRMGRAARARSDAFPSWRTAASQFCDALQQLQAVA